ncbi:MAG: hypothetical protein NC120_06205 [Ruminococcus sp.]|nr:hypothetical protein [Ruminococcus sp.]
MKMTKRLAAIAATAVMAMTSAVGMSASATSYMNDNVNRPNDFSTYCPQYRTSRSNLNCGVDTAIFTSINSDYDYSWKFVSYMKYKYDSSGSVVTQAHDADSGTTTSLACTAYANMNETCKREYTARLHTTSSNASEYADSYNITFNKTVRP